MKRFPHAAGTTGFLLLAGALAVSLSLPPAAAAEYRVNNPTDLKSRTSTLQPGDTLIAEPGTYTLNLYYGASETPWETAGEIVLE